MADYSTHRRRHLRIAILKLMLDEAGYRSNESVLHGYLPGLGLTISRDQVRTELAWLADQDLVTVDDLAGLMVAELTLTGIDVANGHASHPDVQRPSPRKR